jgi:hypothetical protein
VNWVHDVQMCGILGENLSGQRMDRSHSLVSSGGGGGRGSRYENGGQIAVSLQSQMGLNRREVVCFVGSCLALTEPPP